MRITPAINAVLFHLSGDFGAGAKHPGALLHMQAEG